MNLFDIVTPMTMAEAQTDYQKRRQRERDVDAGRPVKASPKNPQTDYAKKRAQDKRDMALGENAWHAGDNAWSSENHEMVENDESNPVTGAIVRRIMMQRTDLLKQYGPELVGAAIDNVADYVGDVEEIGSSDVSGWVNQVERMLEENPPEAFDEGFQDFNKVEPYEVCLAGKCVKTFDYYADARRFHDNWKKKLYAQGEQAKAGKITLNPVMKEAVWFPTVSVPKFPKPEVDNTKWVVTYKIPATGETKIVAVAGDTEEHARKNLLARTPAAKIVSIKSKDMSEAIVASGPSQPLDDRAVRKLVWDTMKINADTGEQAIQRALTVLAKKPQSRMVQDLQDKFQSLADRLAQGLAEAGSPAQQAAIAIAKKEQGIDEVKQRLDAKCWKGKHKEGTKIKGGVRVNNCVPNESVDEAISQKDLVKQVGDMLNDPEFRKQPADPTKSFTKGDHWKGAGPGDYGYTGYQGHGMPTDKAERARIRADKKKGVAEDQKKPLRTHTNDCGSRAGRDCDCEGTLAHARDCGHRYGHDCDCGLDKAKQQGVAEDWIDDDAAEPLAKYFADLYYGDFSATYKVKLTSHIYQAIQNGELSIDQLKADIDMLEKEKGIKEFAPTPVPSDNDDLSTEAQKDGFRIGASSVDGMPLDQAFGYTHWDEKYKLAFSSGWVKGRQFKIKNAKNDGVDLVLQKNGSLARAEGIKEMDKSQPGAAGWNIDDYPLGAKGTTAKPTTVKNVVKTAAKELDAAFNSPEQLKKDADYRAYRKGVKQSRKEQPKPVKESYWTRLQNERNTKLNSLVNELKESIKK